MKTMGVEGEDEDVNLDITEEQEGDVDQQEDADNDDAPAEGEDQVEDEEFSIEIEGEEVEDEPPLVKQLRDKIRDQGRELSEYRKVGAAKIEVGEKPTLEGCDYDEEQFEAQLDAYKERKRQREEQDRDEQQQAEVRNAEGQRRAVQYQQQMGAIPLPQPEKDKAHETVTAALPHMLQAAILQYCDNPAKIVLALAKHPGKLEQLASEPDPIKFILKVKDIERNLKVVNRKKPPAPESESIQSGSAPLSGSSAKTLEKLEAEAARSGDRTKVVAYKAQMRAKAA